MSYADPDGLYALDLPSSFRQVEPPNQAFDCFFVNRADDIVVGVVVDGPSALLDELDAAVAHNARAAYGNERLTVVAKGRDRELGGLPARETEMRIEAEGDTPAVLNFNVHTATTDHNVQVIVGGPAPLRNVIAHTLAKLEGGDFRFVRPVSPKPGPKVWALDDPDVPVRFTGDIAGWKRLPPQKLHEDASLDMAQPEAGLFMMLIIEPLDAETQAAAASDPDYFGRLRALVHSDTADRLTAVPPGTTAPFAPAGNAPDVRWAVSGTMAGDPPVTLTYRIRLRLEADRVFRFYCWGAASERVLTGCDALYDAVDLPALAPRAVETL